jgi:hypothetical protein
MEIILVAGGQGGFNGASGLGGRGGDAGKVKQAFFTSAAFNSADDLEITIGAGGTANGGVGGSSYVRREISPGVFTTVMYCLGGGNTPTSLPSDVTIDETYPYEGAGGGTGGTAAIGQPGKASDFAMGGSGGGLNNPGGGGQGKGGGGGGGRQNGGSTAGGGGGGGGFYQQGTGGAGGSTSNGGAGEEGWCSITYAVLA